MKLRLALLAGVHVAAGLVSALSFPPYPRGPVDPPLAVILFVAVVFADVGLLAIGGVTAVASLRTRIGCIVAGAAYLWLAPALTGGPDDRVLLILFLATFATVAVVVLLATRWHGARLRRFEQGDPLPVAEGLQFSILHLMIVTAIVAVLLATLRGLRGLNENVTEVLVTVYGLTFIVGPLVALWATLGLGKLRVRLPIALGLAALPGFLPAFYFNSGHRPIWFWPTITFLQGVITIGSLLVVRAGGYRLVRQFHQGGT